MFNRKDFKKKSKKNLFKNYNSVAIISLLVALFTSSFFTSRDSIMSESSGSQLINTLLSNNNTELNISINNFIQRNILGANRGFLADTIGTLERSFSSFTNFLSTSLNAIFSQNTLTLLLSLLGLILGLLAIIFIKNIITLGEYRFFLENRLYHKTTISRIFYFYKIKKIIKPSFTLIVKTIYLVLWLFTIVGLPIKFYSYRMVKFIVAENPDIKINEAIKLSTKLMKGYKWSLFLMDLTFLPWRILGIATFTIADIFFVTPYTIGTEAELYTYLRDKVIDEDQETKKQLNDDALFNNEEGLLYYPGSYVEKPKKPPILNYNVKYSIVNIILLFFFISFIGWFWEVLLTLVQTGNYVNRGTLHGFWLPIYGSGSLLILILLKPFRDKPPLLFGMTMLLCGILEYFTSLYLEVTTGLKYWDYTGHVLNLDGRICLEGLLFFAIGGLVVVYFFAPLVNYFLNKIPMNYRIGISGILISAFIIDGIYTHFHPNTGPGITN